MIRLTYERRHELINACWGAVMVALTIVLTAVALWLVVAVAVGSVVMARWIGAVS